MTSENSGLESEGGQALVDYLQLVGGTSQIHPVNRIQEITEISWGIRVLADALIACSQMSRRPRHRPMPSGLRNSGSIEQGGGKEPTEIHTLNGWY